MFLLVLSPVSQFLCLSSTILLLPAVVSQRKTISPTLATVATQTTSIGPKELPSQFQECEIDDLIELIASMLTRLITHNDQIPFTSTSLTRFHSRSPPGISIEDYLKRIDKYTTPNPICFILILNYIDRICQNLMNFTICSLTVHRFCITSVMIGSKFMCDSFYSNSRYAKVGGISLAELNLLEREFLLAIDYRLVTNNEGLNKYYVSLVESHPLYKIQPKIENDQDCRSGDDNRKKPSDDQNLGPKGTNDKEKSEDNQMHGIECARQTSDRMVISTTEHPENHYHQSSEQPIISSPRRPEETIQISPALRTQPTKDQINLDPLHQSIHQTSTVLPDCIQED